MTRDTASEDVGRRKRKIAIFLVVPLAAILVALFFFLRFPSDRTPEGAYLRVAKAVVRDRPEEFFAYLEEPAQHACYTIRDYRKQSLEVVRRSFPPAEKSRFEERALSFANAPDGADVFGIYARREGWLDQLRADISGIAAVTISGERATVQTTRGTRYAFRRRPNGIWGMTAFSPLLVEEAERAARDQKVVESAAADYERSKPKEK